MRRQLLVMLLVMLALPTVQSCGAEDSRAEEVASEPRAVLLMGVDGLEWTVVLPLVREGRLPHLTRLMREGGFGLLKTVRPTESPIVWATVATGVDAAQHGIEGFTRMLENGDEVLYTSRDRKVKAFWNILGDHGRTVHVIGWWNTWPVEPIHGVMVAQTNKASPEQIRAGRMAWKGAIYEGLPAQIHPPERQDAVLARLAEVERALPERTRRIFGDGPEQLDPVAQILWERCTWAFRADAVYTELALDFAETEFDLMAVYLGAADVLGHRFWRYYEPDGYQDRPSDEEISRYGGLIPAYYEEVDRIVGELLQRAGEANVVIVSDHGMRGVRHDTEFTPDKQPAELRSGGHAKSPPGVFIAAGPDFATAGIDPARLERGELSTIGSVRDVTPTLLAVLGLPVGRDMRGRVLEAVIDPAALEARPVRWVNTHTTAEWLRARAEQSAEPLLDEERLQQLRALGYLE